MIPIRELGLKVLIVDDTSTNRQILAVFLRKLGFATLLAEDGAQAVATFQAEQPDLILMDVMMPVMDGYEATRRIKAMCGTRWVPVIFLSALDKDENLVAGLDAGGDDYLYKPVNFVVLDAKLHSFARTLEWQRRLDENARRLQEYHDVQEAERALAQDIVERQMLRKGLSDKAVRHWMAPASNFSGDIVAATRGPTGDLYVMLADATGHGLGAAICTLPVLSVFYSLAETGAALAWIVSEVNHQLLATMPVGRFVAAAVICVDCTRHQAEVWVGGTPDVLLIDAQGGVRQRFPSTQLPLGVQEFEDDQASPQRVELSATDQFVLLSDGLVEATDAGGRQFGIDGLIGALAAAPQPERLAAVKSAVGEHTGGLAPHDDVSLLLIDCG